MSYGRHDYPGRTERPSIALLRRSIALSILNDKSVQIMARMFREL